jgi:hypothetical protein
MQGAQNKSPSIVEALNLCASFCMFFGQGADKEMQAYIPPLFCSLLLSSAVEGWECLQENHGG